METLRQELADLGRAAGLGTIEIDEVLDAWFGYVSLAEVPANAMRIRLALFERAAGRDDWRP